MKQLSVIVPTYNETDNIRPLCERLFKACKSASVQAELIIVDDESRGSAQTESIVKELRDEGYAIKIIMRLKSEGRGLSSAVVLGFQNATYPCLLCMDADLQHEPESVPLVAEPVLEDLADFSVGSRYCNGGAFGFDWAIHRRIISSAATLLAYGVSKSSDPMSGFFCTKKSLFDSSFSKINPIGFKIGLEIMVRSGAGRVADVPIIFRERMKGESKLSIKQNFLYGMQLLNLYRHVYSSSSVFFILILTVIVALMPFMILFTKKR